MFRRFCFLLLCLCHDTLVVQCVFVVLKLQCNKWPCVHVVLFPYCFIILIPCSCGPGKKNTPKPLIYIILFCGCFFSKLCEVSRSALRLDPVYIK